MAEKDKERALVNILERFAGEMTRQEEKIELLIKKQEELSKKVEASGLHLRNSQFEMERSYDNMQGAMTRYRSDMLSLVNEQDRINQNIEELRKELKTTTFTADVTSKRIVELVATLAHHEEVSKTHYEHALKQPELFRESLANTSRDFSRLQADTEKLLAETKEEFKTSLEGTSREFSRLHSDTEKRLTEMQRDTAKELKNFQHETLKRLLLLDGIVSSLEVLMLRTEPPEKKPFIFIRFFKIISIKIRGLFRRARG